jgi:osmotically-inducible protein OsmY
MESHPRQAATVASVIQPQSTAPHVPLALSIRRLVMHRTTGRVRDLEVEVHNSHVRLKGRCSSFYCKQLAQQAAMDLSEVETLTNEIEVV